jgi:CheY-like chemotaxis protein
MNPKRLLVLDDCISLHLYYKIWIEKFDGYSVDVGVNGWEGLVAITTNKYDGIITDLQMPIVNGVEFIQRARERYSYTKPILLHSSDPRMIEESKGKLSNLVPIYFSEKQRGLEYILDFLLKLE